MLVNGAYLAYDKSLIVIILHVLDIILHLTGNWVPVLRTYKVYGR